MHNDRMITLPWWKIILSISARYEITSIWDRAIEDIINFKPHINSVELVALAVSHQGWASATDCIFEIVDAKTLWPCRKGKNWDSTLVIHSTSENKTSQNDTVAEPFDWALVHQAVYEVFWPEQDAPELEPMIDPEATNANHVSELGDA